MASVTGLKVAYQAGTENKTVYASWSMASKYASHLKEYKVQWLYTTGNDVDFEISNSTTTLKNSICNIPDNAIKIKCKVTPISKTYEVKKTVKDKKGKKKTTKVTKSYFSGSSVVYTKDLETRTPPVPSVPKVTINDKNKLQMTVSDIVETASKIITNQIQFYIYDITTKSGSSSKVNVKNGKAELIILVSPGNKYKVRCRAINLYGADSTGLNGMQVVYAGYKEKYSAWTEYSDELIAIPTNPIIKSCTPDTADSIRLVLTEGTLADEFEVEYTKTKKYFDTSTETSSATIAKKSSNSNTIYINGLDSSGIYYFRARAKNTTGYSGWSKIVSTVLGTKPSPPTTWTLSTTATIGDNVTLYWTHNSEDGSGQRVAEIEIKVDNKTYAINDSTSKSGDDPIYSKTINLSTYNCVDGSKLYWRVRTKGIIDAFSNWSTQRVIDVNAKPTLTINLGDDSGILSQFPFNINCYARPTTQHTVSYHIDIKAKHSYEFDNVDGNIENVNTGEVIFSKTVVTKSNPYTFVLSPSNITLKNNEEYIVEVNVAMETGMIAETADNFEVYWDDSVSIPDGNVYVDNDELIAMINPYCEDDDGNLEENVTLAVYRREADGGLIEIANDIANNGITTVIDPHPSLNYTRYRIVAKSKTTNTLSYEDLPPEPVLEKAIVITWDETYSQLEYEDVNGQGEDYPTQNNLDRTILYLPHNVDISENHKNDVSLIEYIGRKNPVSYYGTQTGQSASWSCVILKDDIETLELIRKLSVWLGDVYVREPSGSGYWAKIDVSIDIKHSSHAINISFDIERVEGDI